MRSRTSQFLFLLILSSATAFAQPDTLRSAVSAGPAASTSPQEIAKATIAAHGGDKLKRVKSLLMKGSVELNVMNQLMPGAFSTAISGEKYFFEIVSPTQSLKQVFDGRYTVSSIQGFSLPPVTSLGFPILARVGDAGFVVSASDGKKKSRGFRVTSPEGFYTDFIIDEKTSQIKGYESSYDVGGRIITTSVEVKSFETIDGVLIPKNYNQRFDLGNLTAYVNFKTKTIQVNTPIEDAAFTLK
jgi:hypothetical protein